MGTSGNYQCHRKPGKGPAYLQVSLRSLNTGRSFEERFRTNDSVEQVDVRHEKWEFSYKDQTGYNFIEPTTYDSMLLTDQQVGETKDFLTENQEVQILFIEGKAVSAEMPPTVELKIEDSPEGVKGDSATNVMKPATLETGVTIQVPLFIKEGEIVKIDTKTKKYLGRADS